jgi:hypothetical protein
MAEMTEKEADELDEFFTRTTQKVSGNGMSGIFYNRGTKIMTANGKPIIGNPVKKELSPV